MLMIYLKPQRRWQEVGGSHSETMAPSYSKAALNQFIGLKGQGDPQKLHKAKGPAFIWPPLSLGGYKLANQTKK